ncbi:MAG: hypothetical protein HKP52_04320, partial [Desulfofustis sp.]|nr:hypothetical protein [Desulfofustis sp.]
MKNRTNKPIPKILIVSVITTFLFSLINSLFVPLAFGMTEQRIQEIKGYIQDGVGVVYTIHNLKKGDTLFLSMKHTGGNLDPLLGILKEPEDLHDLRNEAMRLSKEPGLNLLEAVKRFGDNHFMAWDDDSGDGYNAALKYLVPTDGTYYLFAGSMITNQFVYTFDPQFTSGSFELTIGLNTPLAELRKLSADGDQTAIIDSTYIKPLPHIQLLDRRLSDQNNFTFLHLRKLQPGDMLSARLEGKDGQPLPELYLGDITGKPLVFGKTDGSSISLDYENKGVNTELNLYINGSPLMPITEEFNYRLILGINAPSGLHGVVEERGQPVVRNSSDVNIGLSIDQIVNVDQQNETFSVVASLKMIWMEPELAFSPDSCNCSVKKMELDDLISLANKNGIILPGFTLFNQQGNRWSQNEIVFLESSGRIIYQERFTTTLQAPDFDFQNYPFDRQLFKVRVDLNVPTDIFAFKEIDNPAEPLGDELGEEEWTVIKHYSTIEEIPFNNNLKKSRFTRTLEVRRHLNFYVFRIFMPFFLIISISWVIFFLKDYGRQLEVASGNLLVFVAFNFAISNDLPRLGYLTLLDRIIITSFVCAAVVVLISVYQKRLQANGRMELADRIDHIVLIFYPLIYIT